MVLAFRRDTASVTASLNVVIGGDHDALFVRLIMTSPNVATATMARAIIGGAFTAQAGTGAASTS
jgi:hypothetical protein